MARPLRIELAGGVYHVTSRGDRRETIFGDDADRRAWVDLFGEVCERFNWRCHAWCQMGNHYHVVVETAEANLARGMRQLNGVYTQAVNRRYGRVGHVFQGRYKAILVEADAYLVELARYVVLNPVRAGLCKDAVDWSWSSHRALLGRVEAPSWLATDWVLGQFGEVRSRAIGRYEDFVRAGVGLPPIWEALNAQIYLGSEDFAGRMASTFADDEGLSEVPRMQRRPKGVALDAYAERCPSRDQAILEAADSGEFTYAQLSAFFGLHYSSISRIVANGRAARRPQRTVSK